MCASPASMDKLIVWWVQVTPQGRWCQAGKLLTVSVYLSVYFQYTSSIPSAYLQYTFSILPVYLQHTFSIPSVYLQYTVKRRVECLRK